MHQYPITGSEYFACNPPEVDSDSNRLLRMQTDGLFHEELTYRIIGVLFEVHGNLGCGFTEKICQRAIEIELNRAYTIRNRERDRHTA